MTAKQRRIAEAIRVNPEASNSLLARQLDVDRATVRKVRKQGGESVDESRQVVRKPGTHYSEEEIREGLVTAAAFSGNLSRTAQELSNRWGRPVDKGSVRDWLNNYPDVYRDYQSEILPAIHARIAQREEQLIDEISEAQVEVLTQVREKYGDLKAKEAASALRDLQVSKGIAIDKSRLLRDQPTEIVRQESIESLLRWGAAKGLFAVREETIDAEVVEDDA